MKRTIDDATYKKILATIPITCVDVVITHNNQFLLGKRNNEPAKNKWWLLGGRIEKNETLPRAVRRKVKEEANITIKKYSLLTAQDTFFKTSNFGVSTHSINIVYHVTPGSLKNCAPDSQHSELKWFTRIDPRWDAYVKNMLRLAGFK